MLWKTHLRISNEVLRRLGLSLYSPEASRLKDGVLAPDKWGDFPHHHGKAETIRKNLLYARKCFLQDNLLDAYYYLGVALHYIQDSYTSLASFYPKHQSWEEDIEASRFVYDIEKAIQYYLRNNGYQRDRCLRLAQSLSIATHGRDNTLYVATLTGHEASKSYAKPIVDLNLGMKASLVVTESILSSKTCPSLETQLRDVLVQYEAYLRKAEIESANKVIRLIEERDNLISKKVAPTGIISKIKNWIIGVRVVLKNRAAVSKTSGYFHRTHLENVANNYRAATREVIEPFEGWYKFQVPQINLNIVKRQLFSVQEIAEHFGLAENSMEEMLKKSNAPRYYVGNRELVRRPKLDRMLSQFPLNGIKEYPA